MEAAERSVDPELVVGGGSVEGTFSGAVLASMSVTSGAGR